MKKLGTKPQILLVAAGALALSLTGCSDTADSSQVQTPEEKNSLLVENGFRPGPTPGSYLDPDGNPVSEEEALEQVRRTTRRGFGRFGIWIGGGA